MRIYVLINFWKPKYWPEIWHFTKNVGYRNQTDELQSWVDRRISYVWYCGSNQSCLVTRSITSKKHVCINSNRDKWVCLVSWKQLTQQGIRHGCLISRTQWTRQWTRNDSIEEKTQKKTQGRSIECTHSRCVVIWCVSCDDMMWPKKLSPHIVIGP